MKKILTVIACALFAISANAQVFIGGQAGFTRDSNDEETYLSIVPEVGYTFNDNWTIGLGIGYTYYKNNGGSTGLFQLDPYVRYSFLEVGPAKLFVDGGLNFGFPKDGDTQVNLAIRPGVAIPLSDHVSFVGHLGGLGYDFTNKVFGLGVSGNDFSVGIYYNF